MPLGGLYPPHVTILVSNTHSAQVVSLNFSSTTLISPSTQVINTMLSMNSTTIYSTVIFTSIPSVPFTSSIFFQNFQNNPTSFSSFIQGFPWYGGHIPPSSPFVGHVPTYFGVSSKIQNPFIGFSFPNAARPRLYQSGVLVSHYLVEGMPLPCLQLLFQSDMVNLNIVHPMEETL